MSRRANEPRAILNSTPILQHFADDIWLVDGPSVRAAGVAFPTQMVVVKLSDGSLWINSPVVVPREMLDQIVALGPVRYLVAPTPLHTWRLEQWHSRFPEAQLWGAPEIARGFARDAFASIAGIARVTASKRTSWNLLEDAPPAAWAQDLDQLLFQGNYFIEEVEFLHRKSSTLIVADFIQNYRAEDGDFVGNIAKGAAGVLNGGVPRDIRWSFTNRRRARASLKRLLSWNFDKLIVAHSFCVEHNAKAFVEGAFRWLSD